MKLYDIPLLQAVWDRQLFQLSRCVLTQYVGYHFSVCSDTESCFKSSSHIVQRSDITNQLSRAQLLARLKQFYDRGMLDYWGHRYQFFLPTGQARDAFRFARAFYISIGIPGDIDGSGPITAYVPNVAAMQDACLKALTEHYGTLREEQVYGLAKDFALDRVAAA